MHGPQVLPAVSPSSVGTDEPHRDEFLDLGLAGTRVGHQRLQIHGAIVDDLSVTGNYPGDRLRRGHLGISIQARQAVANDV